MAKEYADSSRLADDPWDLPAYFLVRKNKQKSLRTHSGYWKEKEEELTAIRAAGESSSSSTASPPYVGVRKTLEFYLKDGTRGGEGTKTDWIIHEYLHLRKDDDGEALFLQEDVVLRKVFKKCKNITDHQSSLYHQVESCVKAYRQQEQVDRDNYEKELLDRVLYRICTKLQFDNNATKTQVRDAFSESARNKDSGVDCDPDRKSDSVWKHFTKIRSSNDPDEVYAACHRCDKVLRGHPKKHGISHLKRHIRTCSSCTNPSTDEDRAMLDQLRTALVDPYEQQKMDSQEDLTQLDPWDLNLTHPTPWYVTRSLNRQTQGGHWKEIGKEFTAIRMEQMQGCWMDIIDKEITVIQKDHQLQEQVPQPQYMGLRRTLQFQDQYNRKMDWMMFEYQLLDDLESPALLLQGDMVIRKVFDKDEVATELIKIERMLNADEDGGGVNTDFTMLSDNMDTSCFVFSLGDGVNTDITTPSDNMDTPCSVFLLDEGMSTDTTTPNSYSMDTMVGRKHKRTSEVWMHFTKIHKTDYRVVYVVCHTCNRGYTSGRSTNGTSHLRRHTKSCASKRPRTGNENDASTEWETEIWPLFLLLKDYGEH